MRARRLAEAAFAGIALFELAETLAYLWIRADVERVATVGDWFGLDADVEQARLTILIPVSLTLAAFGWLLYVGLSRRSGIVLRWARSARLLFGAYALWALSQNFLLPDVSVYGRVWLGAVALIVGSLAVLGFWSAPAALEVVAPAPFSRYYAAYPIERSPSGLEWQDLTLGRGPRAAPGRTAVLRYTGRLPDGRVFDSTPARGKGFAFPVGAGKVLPGLDEGVATMRQGGRRRLIVPPTLGYGSSAHEAVPADTTLIFDVELIDVTVSAS